MGFSPILTYTEASLATLLTRVTAAVATATALQTVDDLVDDLEGRLTAGRAALLDNIPAGTMPLASAVAAIPTTPINSIQTGYITLGAGVTSTTTSITSVNTSKADIHRRGSNLAAGAAPDEYHADLYISNATTVGANRVTGTREFTQTFSVVEYK